MNTTPLTFHVGMALLFLSSLSPQLSTAFAQGAAATCIDLQNAPAPNGNPWTYQGVSFFGTNFDGRPLPTLEVRSLGSFTGLDCGWALDITLADSFCDSIEVTLVTFESAEVTSYDASGVALETKIMSVQRTPETLRFLGQNVAHLVVIAQADETLLLQLCCVQGDGCCPEVGGVKYVQNPDLVNGIDVNATLIPPDPFGGNSVLADDFRCTNSGPVTDIIMWGSWFHDNVDHNATYTLSIWSDVPTNAPGQFSHPGELLWTQSYTNGQFTRCLYANLLEGFYTAYLDPMFYTTNLYQICFLADPANMFHQTGTPTAPTNYWLSVAVQASFNPARYFGWKSSAVAYNGSAVAATATLHPTPGDWRRLNDLEGDALNLAFAVTTSTNPCPLPLIQCTNREVECATAWTNVPPTVLDPCCTNPGPVKLAGAVTNGPTCAQQILLNWQYTNCQRQSASCVQTIFVRDRTPPILACTTNKNVQCGSPWDFDPPAASDACCGTNVTVTVLSTVTNGTGCSLVATRTWEASDCCSNTASCTQQVTVVTPPFTSCCGAAGGAKYVQNPDLANGFDIDATLLPFDPLSANAWVLADNFTCTISGPITDIVLWGSWLNDNEDSGAIFFVGIWSDVPTNATNLFAHPGVLLWSQAYTNGAYSRCAFTNSPEGFVNAGLQPMGYSTNLNQICFRAPPANTFYQTGTPAAPTNYWLSVTVLGGISSGRYFGWKSTAVDERDPAVASRFAMAYPPPNEWFPLIDLRNDPINLAFAVITSTNSCPCSNRPTVLCPSNMFVTACSTDPVAVHWVVGASDVCGGLAGVASSPPTGTAFLPDTTNIVTAWAWTQCLVTNWCAFTVTVVRVQLDLKISRSGGTITLHWSDGILQQASTVTGPYTDVPMAAPPTYTVPATGAGAFYRLRCGPNLGKRITVNDGPGDQMDPHVSGDLAVYTDIGPNTIRYYSFLANINQAIPKAPTDVDSLADVSGTRITFSRAMSDRRACMVYDTAANALTQIAPQVGSQRFATALGGSTVAFVEGLIPQDSEIMIYDLATSGPLINVSLSAEGDYHPNVAPSGNAVVWERCDVTFTDCRIMKSVRTGGVWNPATIVSDTPYLEANPDTDGVWIVYDSERPSTTGPDIYFQPLSGGGETRLALPGIQVNPRIRAGMIAFESIPNPGPADDRDIFVYIIAAATLLRVTDSPYVNEILNDIDVLPNGDIRVVWAADDGPGGEFNVYARTFTPP